MSLNGSYGLIVDLGLAPSPEKLEKLYHTLWSPEYLKGPESTLAEFGKIPRGAQGQLVLPSGQAIACYTRFERDNLGYPAGWQAPVLLGLGLSTPSLSRLPEAQTALVGILNAVQAILPLRMAVMGHSNLYHVNAEWIGPEWLDLQAELLLGLWLPRTHPLLKALGIKAETELVALTPQDWSVHQTELSEAEKYKRYKTALKQSQTEPKIQLQWEN